MPKQIIIYRQPSKDAYDSPPLTGFLLDEFPMTEPVKLPKDYVKIKKVALLNPDGTTSKLKFGKPKNKKK